MLFILAFTSGIFTILSPCIWHVLPLILSANLEGSKRYSAGISLGISFTFGIFVLLFNYLVRLIPVDSLGFRYFSLAFVFVFGLILLIRPLSEFVETLLSRFTSMIKINISKTPGFFRGIATGAGLSFLWSPCAGPILIAISSVGATQELSLATVFFALSYSLGVSVPLFVITILGHTLSNQLKRFTKYTKNMNQITGAIFIMTAFMIYFGVGEKIEAYMVERYPVFSNLTNILENSPTVTKEINKLQK